MKSDEDILLDSSSTEMETTNSSDMSRSVVFPAPLTYSSRELLELIQDHLAQSRLYTTAQMLQNELHQCPPSSELLPWPSSSGMLLDGSSIVKTNSAYDERTHGKCVEKSLHSLGTDYLALQHGDCVDPVTTLPPIPLSQPHQCPPSSELLPWPSSSGMLLDGSSVVKTNPAFDERTHRTCVEKSLHSLGTDYLALQHGDCVVPVTSLPPIPLSQPHQCPPSSELLPWSSSSGILLDGSLIVKMDPTHDERTHNQCVEKSLHSIVIDYLALQHGDCVVPVTTLPPLPLSQPHQCHRSRQIPPLNLTARMMRRQLGDFYGRLHRRQGEREFFLRRLSPWDSIKYHDLVITSFAFVGSSQIVLGCTGGWIKFLDLKSKEVHTSNMAMDEESPISLVEAAAKGNTNLVLSSISSGVCLWDAESISSPHLFSMEGCNAGRFSNSGSMFAALSTGPAHEVLLYDIQTLTRKRTLTDLYYNKLDSENFSTIHFGPPNSKDNMVMFEGILWDLRMSEPIHRFERFSNFGGGGFHPFHNEVIINSEVVDLRKYKLLQSIPCLDQTKITFDSHAGLMYATRRRIFESLLADDYMLHDLRLAYCVMDARDYATVATVNVGRDIINFALQSMEVLREDRMMGILTFQEGYEIYLIEDFESVVTLYKEQE